MSDKSRILVVDDELVVCKSVQKILARQGFEVDYSLDAADAREKLAEERFHVVITDLMMPGINGMELLASVKKKTPELPVIMITGYATFKTAVQAIKLGAFDYIPKPFLPEELTAVTIRALERRRIQEEEPEKIPPRPEVVEKKAEPGDIYILPEHSWAKIETDGRVRIGMDDLYQLTLGTVVNIDLPFKNDDITQGKACARITGKDMRPHSLWSPVSGKVVKVNEELANDATIANRDPYGHGWIALIRPSNLEEDLKNLLHYTISR